MITTDDPRGRSPLRYLSVCSGIEAATQAWHGLGWIPVAFSEIEKFPCAVLAHHYPETPNWGDMTRFKEWPDADPDVLCGGTPCQSFSVAGLRQGLADPRGNLMLTFGAIAARYRPRWLCWENVPGVLSSEGGRDFASLLGLLTGQQIDVPEGGWQNSGIVPGIADAYGIAYRVLDAQYVRTRRSRRAVPQRRRRVFVVGYLGDWRRAAAVLFDAESLRRDPPPRREAGKATPAPAAPCPDGSCSVGGCDRPAKKRGWCNTHYQRWRKHGAVADTPVNEPGRPDADRFWEKVAKSDGCWEWTAALNEKGYGVFWSGAEQRLVRAHRFSYEQSEGEIPEGLELDHKCRNRKCVRPDHLEPVTGGENTRRGNAGKHWAEKRGEYDVAPTISARPTGGGGLGTDFDLDGGLIARVVLAGVEETAGTLCRQDHGGVDTQTALSGYLIPVAPTLRGEGFDATDDGTGKGTPIIPVAYGIRSDATRDGDAKTPSADAEGKIRLRRPGMGITEGVAPTLDAGIPHAVAFNSREDPDETGATPTLRAMTPADSHQNGGGQLAVAFDLNQITSKTNRSQPNPMVHHTLPATSTPPHLATPWAVRRLTPVECERLMDFPDGFTAIAWRGKSADRCPDGPRYKALGNSWACNVAEWVGERINEVDQWD